MSRSQAALKLPSAESIGSTEDGADSGFFGGEGVEAKCKGGRGHQSIICPNFSENCMKMKKLGPKRYEIYTTDDGR